MAVKSGGLLARTLKIADETTDAKICETCANLIRVSDNALGCTAHDKLIIPDLLPYHGKMMCADWSAKKGAEG